MTDDKRNILIIGGTGTLGKTVVEMLYNHCNITILSREESKQQALKKQYPKCKFVIGDIRDAESLSPHFYGKDTVFHFAAMKHVDVAEANPEESVKINLIGSINVGKLAVACGVPYTVFTSTDKAVLPINTYGMCKGISEKYFFNLNDEQNITKFSVFRYGNVLGSRGSVIHGFLKTLKEKNTVHITDARMSRFWIDIKDAAKFILDNYESAPSDVAMIPPMKASRIVKLAELCARHLNLNNYEVKYCGIRAGEKLHEVVHSSHDVCVRSDNVEEYSDDELLNLIERAANL